MSLIASFVLVFVLSAIFSFKYWCCGHTLEACLPMCVSLHSVSLHVKMQTNTHQQANFQGSSNASLNLDRTFGSPASRLLVALEMKSGQALSPPNYKKAVAVNVCIAYAIISPYEVRRNM